MKDEGPFSLPLSQEQEKGHSFAPFECVMIAGVGLMGGSLGLALRAQGLARRVIGVGRNADTLVKAQRLGAIDAGTTDLIAGAKEADLIVLAAPVSVIPSQLEALAPHTRPDALLTDMGSTKAHIVDVGTRLFGTRFVGSHPMAGSEQSGIEAARGDLYAGAAWAIVRPAPFALQEDAPAARIAALAAMLGARPVLLEAQQHDRLVALVSHLPHILSFAFARTVGADESAEQAREIAAGSYRDMMRVSHANPALWRDIFADNRDALLDTISAFETHLHALKSALASADPDAILTAIQAAHSSADTQA